VGEYDVTVADVDSRATAVVPALTTWSEFPGLWQGMLGEVWECLRAAGIRNGCPNVMLYRGDAPVLAVEVGVHLTQPCPLAGRVVASTLPAGQVATTVHRGSYAGLAAAHEAVLDWCDENDRRIDGTRWEIYGPHRDDPEEVWTEVSWLLAP
jgi:effector-binding domain-containing protein